MNLEQLAEQINEDLTRRVVPMDELRVGVQDGKFAVIGSSVMRLPNGWKYSTPQEIGSMVAIFDDPIRARRRSKNCCSTSGGVADGQLRRPDRGATSSLG